MVHIFTDFWDYDDTREMELRLLIKNHKRLADLIEVLGSINGNSVKAYLTMMAIRLIEIHRILKPTGSVYLHCDPTMSHHLKLVMDYIFGRGNFRNEIIWCYQGAGQSKKHYKRKHDILFFYSKSHEHPFNWEAVGTPFGDKQKVKYTSRDNKGIYKTYKHRDGTVFKHYFDDSKVMPPLDWWVDISIIQSHKERTGFPTQKPLKLLERVIKGGSNVGDVVLDPFAGCATACVSAELLGRKWIGIDVEIEALTQVKERISKHRQIGYRQYEPIHRTDIPKRTDLGEIRPYKEHKRELYSVQEGNCATCGNHYETGNLEIDHIVAQARGGTDHKSNLQLLCGACHNPKGTLSQAEHLAKLRRMGRINGNERSNA